MTSQNQKSPPYTLAFRIPNDFRKFMSACNRKLHEVVRSFEPPDMWHLTVKFLGHSSENLNDEAIIDLLPELYDLTKKYLPLTIYIRGFSTFTYKNNRNSVIFLKVMPNKALIEMHYEICEKFSDRFIFFDHADKDNFEPHITLSKDLYKGKDEKIERLVARSRKMAKRRLKLDDLVVMSPTRLFPVTKEINRPLICPPVK